MVINAVKSRSYFYQVAQDFYGIRRHSLRKNIALEHSSIYSVDFRVPIQNSHMSTLKPINCRHGFHTSSNTPAINLSTGSEIQGTNSPSSNVQATPDIEKKYVHHVYDAIAPHFSSTRFAKWPKVAGFLDSLNPNSVILDAGCGNGKYLGFNPCCFYIGCDISPPLIEICASRGHEILVADAVNLPYRSNFGNAVLSIAVLHHLSTEKRRRKAIEELIRVVQKGGLVLITVWAVEQEDQSLLTKWTPLSHKYNEGWISLSRPRTRITSTISLKSIPETNTDGHHFDHFDKVSKDAQNQVEVETNQEYFVPWHLPFHRAEICGASASALANGLAKKDEKGAVVYNRYYHVFVEGELESLVSGIDNAEIQEQFYDKSNWCIVLKKV